MPPLDLETFRQIVDTLPVGVYVVGLDRKISYWNRAAEQITGYLGQEVVGRPCHADALVHCGARGTPVCASAGCLLTCALRDGKQIEAMLFARHKDGHRIPVNVRSLPLHDQQGKVFAVAELFQQQSQQSDLRWTSEPITQSPNGLHGPSILATEAYLNQRLKSPERVAVFLIALQEKEALARQRGWEMVHSMTRSMVQTVTDLLSMPHFLGRWHGDRFLVIVPNATQESFEELLGQLEGVGNSCSVTWWGDRVQARVQVRGTLLRAGDALDSLFTRIDPDGEPEGTAR